jgi:hypothetical protein
MPKHAAASRLCLFALALAVAGAIALSAPAGAQEAKSDESGKDAFVARLFAGAVEKPVNYACFTRVYDAAHLSRHKLQKVAAMKLLVTADRQAEQSSEGASAGYSFRLGLKYRDRAAVFESAGYCGNGEITEAGIAEPHLGCGIDCDGGGIEIALTNADKSAKVTLERVRIWPKDNADEDKAQELTAGADDKEFRLDRAPLSECAPLVSDRKERAAMLRGK